jgi:hypothetical protein
VNIPDASASQGFLGALDRARDLLGRFDLGALDVDDAETEPDVLAQFLEHGELLRRAVRAFHDDVVDLQRVQVVDQLRPAASLDRLPAVVAEAQVHGGLRGLRHGLEHLVDRGRSPLPFLRMTGKVGFVELHDGGVQPADLLGEHRGDRVRELRRVAVVPVVERLRQHVRAGDRELERPAGKAAGARAGDRQVERSRFDRAGHHARRASAKAHARGFCILEPLRKADVAADAGHRPGEVLDHPVRLGMVRIEAVQLAVAHQIDPRLLLRREDDARCIGKRLLGRRGGQPVGNRVRADDGGADARCFHGGRL